MGVTSLGRHLRPACYQALRGTVIKTMQSMWINLLCVCSFPHGVT